MRTICTWRDWRDGVTPGYWLRLAACRCSYIAGQKQRAELQRRAEANLPQRAIPLTFANFNNLLGTTEAREQAEAFASTDGPRCLLLCGQTGCGKSHLLEAIGHWTLDNSFRTVRYETASAFLDRLRHTFRDDGESVTDVVAWYQSRDVLLLDDLGTRAEKDWAIQELTDLVDERMRNGLWLVVATNLVRDEMAEAVGDRLASRLFQVNEELRQVSRVTMTAGDYRMASWTML